MGFFLKERDRIITNFQTFDHLHISALILFSPWKNSYTSLNYTEGETDREGKGEQILKFTV